MEKKIMKKRLIFSRYFFRVTILWCWLFGRDWPEKHIFVDSYFNNNNKSCNFEKICWKSYKMLRIVAHNSCNLLKNSSASKIPLNQSNVVLSRNVMTKKRNFEIPQRSTDGRKKITPFGWFLLVRNSLLLKSLS